MLDEYNRLNTIHLLRAKSLNEYHLNRKLKSNKAKELFKKYKISNYELIEKGDIELFKDSMLIQVGEFEDTHFIFNKSLNLVKVETPLEYLKMKKLGWIESIDEIINIFKTKDFKKDLKSIIDEVLSMPIVNETAGLDARKERDQLFHKEKERLMGINPQEIIFQEPVKANFGPFNSDTKKIKSIRFLGPSMGSEKHIKFEYTTANGSINESIMAQNQYVNLKRNIVCIAKGWELE